LQFIVQGFFPYLNYIRAHNKYTLTLDAITLQEMIRYTWNFVRMITRVIIITCQNFTMISILVLILERLSRNIWDAPCKTFASHDIPAILVLNSVRRGRRRKLSKTTRFFSTSPETCTRNILTRTMKTTRIIRFA